MKVKWKLEEEMALRKGVHKHGQGNWIKILHDSPLLFRRSNVDIKDKWRNMTERAKEMGIDLLNGEDQSLAEEADKNGKNFISPQTHKRKAAPRYNEAAMKSPMPKRPRKLQKVQHNSDLVCSSKQSSEVDEPKSDNKPVEKEDAGGLKQLAQGIFGRCKRAIAWNPFGSISRTGC